MSTTVHYDGADYHITTNNQPRPLVDVILDRSVWRLPTMDELLEGEATTGFIYRGNVYALDDFSINTHIPEASPLKRFSGFMPTSYFDCIAITFVDGDYGDISVIVAHVHW
jgi:hypothetical protein